MRIMGDGNQILLAVVADGMDARHLPFANAGDRKLVGLCFTATAYRTIRIYHLIHTPIALAVKILDNLLSQCDGCSTGMIQLVYMVHLFHLHIILRELVHDLGQIAVHGREDGHTHREVRGPEQRITLFRTHPLHVITMFLHPSSRTRYHLHALGKSLQVVTVCSLRSCELNGHISRSEGLALKVLLVVDINNTHNFMATAFGDLLDHLSHLSVAD